MEIVDTNGNVIGGADVSDADQSAANAAAREYSVGLAGKRDVLTADQLAHLISPGVRFENEYKFQDKSAYFFTINGVLNGRKIEGALFAGECILVFDTSVLKGKDLAVRGLRATVELLHEEYNTRQQRDERDLMQQGIHSPDTWGRRARGYDGMVPSASAHQRAKMTAMIRHVFSGYKEPYIL